MGYYGLCPWDDTIPSSKSRARRRIETSSSSRQLTTKSRCSLTAFGCIFMMLLKLINPKYFTFVMLDFQMSEI
jgi:hypothetical protein